MNLKLCLERQDIWRGGQRTATTSTVVPSGFDALDYHLPGGGWPLGALTEIMVDDVAHSPLWLILPALVRLTTSEHHQLWVQPPHVPYPPALARNGIDLTTTVIVRPKRAHDALWATEQALRSRACSAVLYWPNRLPSSALRRLQLAAEISQAWALCFRSGRFASRPTMAALRLGFKPTPTGAALSILKCRGGRTVENLTIHRTQSSQPPDHSVSLSDHCPCT